MLADTSKENVTPKCDGRKASRKNDNTKNINRDIKLTI